MPLLSGSLPQGMTYDPSSQLDLRGLSMLAERAREARKIAQERRTLRALMEKVDAGEMLPETKTKPTSFLGRLAGMFGIGEEYQPLSELERLMGEQTIKSKYGSVGASEALSQIELAQVLKRLKQDRGIEGEPETDLITDRQIPPEEIAPITKVTPTKIGQPQPYIQIQEGYDKYGLPQYKTVKNPEHEMWLKEQETRIAGKGEIFKLSETGRANFGRAVGMFSTLVGTGKGMQEEQKEFLGEKGIETTGLGLVPGMAGKYGQVTKRPEFSRTQMFRGQRAETAISLNSILTGQNRVIRSVIKLIESTLPDQFDPEPVFAGKLSQSITNAYKLVKSFEKAGYTSKELNNMSQTQLDNIDAKSLITLYGLTSSEEKELERIIQDVLKTPMMPTRAFGQPEKIKEKKLSPVEAAEELRRRGLVR